MLYWGGYLLILLFGVGGLIALMVYLHQSKTPHPLLENVLLTTLAIFVTVMALEFYFKVFFAQPDSVPTLANANWLAWYHPQEGFNSLKYRDVEWTDELVSDKTKVMVEEVEPYLQPILKKVLCF